MKFVVRLILMAVLVAFAAGSVAYSAGSAHMAATMAAADATMDRADCDGCGESDFGSMNAACDPVCGAGVVLAVPPAQAQAVGYGIQEAFGPIASRDLSGLTAPPAGPPPRNLI